MKAWLAALSPDFVATIRRFPLSIALMAGATILLVLGINRVRPFDDPYWMGVFFGLVAAAGLAVGGVHFAESRPAPRWLVLLLGWLAPGLAVVVALLDNRAAAATYLLPLLAALWMSIAGFTRWRGTDRALEQRRFWWLNQYAVATASIALATFLVIALGTMAIERALATLFAVPADQLLYRIILPVVGCLLTPVFWLSTLPRVADYRDEPDDQSDVLLRAAGMLGQFVLVPLLMIYAVILLAYAAQILVTRTLPQGTIGWMSLGFLVTGAATWLVLYPSFLDDRPVVRFFRRVWFWLTLVPLALFGIAVLVRVEAYGLTPERLLLVGGGVWAAMLTAAFLIGRGDIRLIPGLAALVILVLAVGPLNLENWSRLDQASRLDAAMTRAGVSGLESVPTWTARDAEIARSAIIWLAANRGADDVARVLSRHQVPFTHSGDSFALDTALRQARLPATTADVERSSVSRNVAVGVDVGATPYFIDDVSVYPDSGTKVGGLTLRLSGGVLEVADAAAVTWIAVPLDGVVAAASADGLGVTAIDFVLHGTAYRLVLSYLSLESGGPGPVTERHVTYLSGFLFRNVP